MERLSEREAERKKKVSGVTGSDSGRQEEGGGGWWHPLLPITFDRLKVVLGIVSSDSLRFHVEAVGFCF